MDSIRAIQEVVDEHKEESDEHGHPAWHHLWRDEEAYPGHHHKQTRRKIVDVEIFLHVSLQLHLHT